MHVQSTNVFMTVEYLWYRSASHYVTKHFVCDDAIVQFQGYPLEKDYNLEAREPNNIIDVRQCGKCTGCRPGDLLTLLSREP